MTANSDLYHVRPAEPEDAPWMLEIYAPAVLGTAISFEETPPTFEEFGERIRQTGEKYSWLACTVNGEPAGYAYASAHRHRAAYAWSVESSVYVAEEYRGRGIGRRLYDHLFPLLKEQGRRNVYGIITLPNPSSVALHQAFGFREIGVHPHAGFKLGEWHDVLWMQLDLWEEDDKGQGADQSAVSESRNSCLAPDVSRLVPRA